MCAFDIKKLMDIIEKDKYAATVAAFQSADLIDQIENSKVAKKQKIPIQIMNLLAEKKIQWSYISEEDRMALKKELGDRERDHTQVMARGARYGQLIDTEKSWNEENSDAEYKVSHQPTEEELAEFKNSNDDSNDEHDLGEELADYDPDTDLLGKKKNVELDEGTEASKEDDFLS